MLFVEEEVKHLTQIHSERSYGETSEISKMMQGKFSAILEG
jgi:hypothetical protein